MANPTTPNQHQHHRDSKHIVLSCMEDSVFNRSIWEGLARGFEALGHRVLRVGDSNLPSPESLAHRPDLLLAVHGGSLDRAHVERYRRFGVATAVYLLDEPYEVDRSSRWARFYDWVLTVDRQTVAVHERWARTLFLPLGFDEERFRAYGKSYASTILILGSPYEHRLHLLAPLRKSWGARTTWVGPGWRSFCPDGQHVEDYVSPDVCARFYRGARIVVNIHRDSFWSHWGETNRRRIEATHLNPRFWEAAACGAFQLTSYRADLESFAPDSASFTDSEQLHQQLGLGLEDEARRASQIHEMSGRIHQHSYRERCQTIINKIVMSHDSDSCELHRGSLKSASFAVDNTGEAGAHSVAKPVVASARKPSELNQGGV